MKRESIEVWGNGEIVRDYIYVDDLVTAFLKAAVSDRSIGQIYNMGFGRSYRFSAMVEVVLKVAGKGKIKYVPWPEDYEKIETGSFEMSLEKAKKDLGWAPVVELKEGLKRMHEYYQKFRQYYW